MIFKIRKILFGFLFLFACFMFSVGITEAGCKLISGKQEIKLDVDNDAPGFELLTSAYEIAEAIILDCPETEFQWFLYTIKFSDMSLGNNNTGGNFNYGGFINEIPNAVQEGFVKSNIIPKIISHCPQTISQTPILDFSGDLSSYVVWLKSNSKIYVGSEAYVECEDTVVVDSPVATTIEVPIHVSGQIVSAISFGEPPDTSANGKLKLTGQFAGQTLDISGEANAVSTIPSVEDGSLVNLDKEIKVTIPVNVGTTEFTYKFKAEGSTLSTAKGLSSLNIIASAANTGVQFPQTIRVGNFQGEMGQALPEGIEIKSKITGQLYGKTGGTGSSAVTVPDLSGFIYSGSNNSLETALSVVGLTLGNVTEEDDSSSKGTVIGQSLTAGEEVQTGTVIDITVSKGQVVDVPDLTNLTLEEAQVHLNYLNLTPEIIYTPTDQYSENQIITQQPSAGSQIKAGAVLTIWVAKKLYTEVTVPDVSGLTKEIAAIVLEQAGLLLDEDNILTESSDVVDQGKIIRSTVELGASVPEGTKIGVVISSGSDSQGDLVVVPRVKNLKQAEAENQLTLAGLSVGDISSRYSETVATTRVIWQSVSPGEQVNKGAVVDLIISKGYPDLSDADIGYADVVIDAYYSGVIPEYDDFFGAYSSGFIWTIIEHQSPLVVLGNIDEFLSLPTGSYVIVGFTNNTVIDAPDQDDIFIEEYGSRDERADIYVSSNNKDFVYLGTAGDGGVSTFDLAAIGYTSPVTAVKIVGLDNYGTPGFDLVSVKAVEGAVAPPLTDSVIELSSSMQAYAYPISGTLAEQIEQLNAGPPPFDPNTWQPVQRHSDFHEQASFVCGESSENLSKPYVSANEFIEGADEVTFDNCSSAFYRFTFGLSGDCLAPCLEGVANVDDQGIVFLNGHQLTQTMTEQDRGRDSMGAMEFKFSTWTSYSDEKPETKEAIILFPELPTDTNSGFLLTWPTQDTFKTCESSYFVQGTNELVFGIVGDASPYDPTGLEFKAVVTPCGRLDNGDVNLDCVPRSMNLQDAILALQTCTGSYPYSVTGILDDVNGDDKIGLQEAIYVLENVAGIRKTPKNCPVTSIWTDWKSGVAGLAGRGSGTLFFNNSTINVAYTGEVRSIQTSGGTNWWTEGTPAPYTGNEVIDSAPPASDIIIVKSAGITNTLTFSAPLTDPVMAFVSVGDTDMPVGYVFDAPFTILSEGEGYWGDGSLTQSGNTLTGAEGHGAIQFNGTFSSISWTNNAAENWHGFTIGVPYNQNNSSVLFPDPNLEAVVREAINKPTGEILESDLLGLKMLVAYQKEIKSIVGLEYCADLNTLYINGNEIEDISSLAGLTKLVILILGDNQISDISALKNLVNLSNCFLSQNQISDISALAGLTKLDDLSLSINSINDISALANLTDLRHLRLTDNQISDISPIASLTNLTDLWLTNNQISDISAIANLTKLSVLWLENNQISDISALAAITDLTHLSLDNNQISDISVFANLKKLPTIYLSNNQISDISVFGSLENSNVFYLDGNQISDIKPLVDNNGIDSGDWIRLTELASGESNPLSTTSCTVYIPQLQDRGVTVLHDCP